MQLAQSRTLLALVCLTKGGPEAVFAKCTHFECQGEIFEMEPILVGDLLEQVNSLNEDGLRVLAIATKKVEKRRAYAKADERDLVLTGYIAFLDPPKETAIKAIAALRQHGVNVKVLTGDNHLVTRKVCSEVGIHADKILLGKHVESMSDADLDEAVQTIDVFARLSPSDKQRVVQALQKKGHVVGFMGDGINDAPSLRISDVGISVDIAKVIGASAWLPYVPMAPIQVLTNNLLYDFSQAPIPTDNVGLLHVDKTTAPPR
jgi:Mg2+-importing ATPase